MSEFFTRIIERRKQRKRERILAEFKQALDGATGQPVDLPPIPGVPLPECMDGTLLKLRFECKFSDDGLSADFKMCFDGHAEGSPFIRAVVLIDEFGIRLSELGYAPGGMNVNKLEGFGSYAIREFVAAFANVDSLTAITGGLYSEERTFSLERAGFVFDLEDPWQGEVSTGLLSPPKIDGGDIRACKARFDFGNKKQVATSLRKLGYNPRQIMRRPRHRRKSASPSTAP